MDVISLHRKGVQNVVATLGTALTKKLNNEDDTLVYTLHGDGELQEGQIWEAAMYAAANKVDNIIATVDLNGKQIDGSTDDVLAMGDLKAKFEAFDWDVLEIKEGNNIEAILAGMNDAKGKTGKGKPVCILLYTEMGNGVDFMENKADNILLQIPLPSNANQLNDSFKVNEIEILYKESDGTTIKVIDTIDIQTADFVSNTTDIVQYNYNFYLINLT